ncbi:hypothetical protein ACFOQM_19220 [Paenibacillus sp. GCM10012307]|uniref:hypothetical protein n=1 Tax=Paenibacillus sp. GCM10012307 TaxID=3317343 RepID=UPI00361AFC96
MIDRFYMFRQVIFRKRDFLTVSSSSSSLRFQVRCDSRQMLAGDAVDGRLHLCFIMLVKVGV